MSNKGINKGFDPCYDYSELIKYSNNGKSKHNIKRIYQKKRRKKLNNLINDELSEIENNEED